MTQTIIELAYDTDSDGDLIIAGNPDVEYEDIKPYITAIEHNMNNGIASTLYRVGDDAPQSAIDTIVGVSSNHADHGIERGIGRGLEMQPGTPTAQEVDDLNNRLSNLSATTPDLTSAQPSQYAATHVFNDLPDDNIGGGPPSWANNKGGPGASGRGAPEWSNAPNKTPWGGNETFADVMKNGMPSVGDGQWRCVHPDHSSPELNPVGDDCSLGHSDDVAENDYAQQHRAPFDPTSFL